MTASRPRPMKGLVPRAAWGARLATCKTPLIASHVQGIAVHYSAANADETSDHRLCAARVRQIQAYHMDDSEHRWCDIAYSFIVCKHGAIFAGRGWWNRTAAQGTNDGNDRFLAACFLGDDTRGRDDVTDPGRAAFRRIFDRYAIWYGKAPQLRPHSFFHATGCPGDELRAFTAVENRRRH